MRIWHTELIEVLPREQLIAQWRELSAIAGAIIKNGTPNHILVNFVLHYPWKDFISYAYHVRQEMTKRGYRTMNNVWEKICSLNLNPITDADILPLSQIYPEKMNKEYCKICYYNLLEKYRCGGIIESTWQQLDEYYQADDLGKYLIEIRDGRI